MKGVIRYYPKIDDEGNLVELPRYFVDGAEVAEGEYLRHFPDKPFLVEGDGPAICIWKPIESMALGVHPRQVEEANARNKRHGVGVQYSPDGKAHLTSRANRKKLLQLEALHDNSAGYGD